MSIQVEYKRSHPSGTVPTIESWIATLSVEEQAEFAAAAERQQAIFDPFLQAGTLDVSSGKQVWASEAAMNAAGRDPIWANYFLRYATENGITVTTETASV